MNLLNRSATKKYILQYCRDKRGPGIITRISDSSLCILEAKLKNMIKNEIEHHPSGFKTFEVTL